MAFTRNALKAMGVPEDKIDGIIDLHTDVTDALIKQRDGFKKDAEQLPEVKSELEKLKLDKGSNEFEQKYNNEHKAFEEYKKEIEAKKSQEIAANLYVDLLKKCKVAEKYHDVIIKATDIKSLKIKDNKLENSENLEKQITETWADFIPKQHEDGAKIDNPPDGNKDDSDLGSLSMEEYIKARTKNRS